MHILINTRYAKYIGEIHIPARGGESEEKRTYRLQDVLNNPLLLYGPQDLRCRMVRLTEVTVTLQGQSIAASATAPAMYIDPAHIELVYDVSSHDYGDTKAEFERHLSMPHAVKIEVLTYSQKRITGTASLGLRMFTNPEPDKKFFALSEAQIEDLKAGSASDKVDYLLINREYVVSFRDIPAA